MVVKMHFFDVYMCQQLNAKLQFYDNYLMNRYRLNISSLDFTKVNELCFVLRSRLQKIVDKYIPADFDCVNWSIDFDSGEVTLNAAH